MKRNPGVVSDLPSPARNAKLKRRYCLPLFADRYCQWVRWSASDLNPMDVFFTVKDGSGYCQGGRLGAERRAP